MLLQVSDKVCVRIVSESNCVDSSFEWRMAYRPLFRLRITILKKGDRYLARRRREGPLSSGHRMEVQIMETHNGQDWPESQVLDSLMH